jgi:hypothetical protein
LAQVKALGGKADAAAPVDNNPEDPNSSWYFAWKKDLQGQVPKMVGLKLGPG